MSAHRGSCRHRCRRMASHRTHRRRTASSRTAFWPSPSSCPPTNVGHSIRPHIVGEIQITRLSMEVLRRLPMNRGIETALLSMEVLRRLPMSRGIKTALLSIEVYNPRSSRCIKCIMMHKSMITPRHQIAVFRTSLSFVFFLPICSYRPLKKKSSYR